MNRLFAILSLVLVLIFSGIGAVFNVYKIVHHKAEMKKMMKAEFSSGLHPNDLVVFSHAQLKNAKWEHSKEFFLGAEKYDVVSVKDSLNQVFYICVNDKKEMALLNQLEKSRKRQIVIDDYFKKINLIHSVSFVFNFHSLDLNLFQNETKSSYKFSFYNKSFRPPIA